VAEGDSLAPVRVLIVDDSEVVAGSLERILARQPDIDVVGVARTERDALTLSADQMTDVVVMDYRLGETDGIRAAERVRRIQPTVRVLLLTGDVTDSYMQGEVLPDAVRRAHAGTLRLAGGGPFPA